MIGCNCLYSQVKSIAVFFCLLFFLLAGSMATNCSASGALSYQEQRALYESQQKLKNEGPKQAIPILQEYIRKHEDEISAKTYLLLGNCWYELDNVAQARQLYSQGLEIEPKNTNLLLNFAITCYASQKYQQAGQTFKKLYQLSKDLDPEYLYRSGASYFQLKEFLKAQNVLRRLIEVHEDELKPVWVELLIHTSIRLKDWDTAKDSLYRILDLEVNKQYWKLLAQVFLRQERYQQAASVLEIAYSLHSPKASELKDLAGIYSYLNLPLKSAKALERAYGQNKAQEELVRLSRLYAQAYRYNKAVESIEKAIRVSPESSLYLKKGRLCYQAGFYEKAIKALQRSIDLDSKQGEALILLGYSAWHLRDWDLAKSAFAQAKDFSRYRQQAKDSINSFDFVFQARDSSENDDSASS